MLPPTDDNCSVGSDSSPSEDELSDDENIYIYPTAKIQTNRQKLLSK